MILVVNDYDGLYSGFWAHLGDEITLDPTILFQDPSRIKLVCFTGGSDVSPKLYGHQNLASHNDVGRDEKESLIFEMAQKHEIPMTGICRGSQFLNVMCGGTMVQHLKATHGGGVHRCQANSGREFLEFDVTSSHHQMSVPGPGGEVLAVARLRLNVGNCVYDGELPESVQEASDKEEMSFVQVTEALHYPEFRVFAVQHHPEWQGIDEEAPQWTLSKTSELCLGKKRPMRTSLAGLSMIEGL